MMEEQPAVAWCGSAAAKVEEEVCRVFTVRVLSLRGVRARELIKRELRGKWEFECSCEAITLFSKFLFFFKKQKKNFIFFRTK